MKKKDNKKEMKEKDCNCSEECNCGCNDGQDCTCEDVNENSCDCSCEDCSRCGEGFDPNTIIQLLSTKNQDLEEKYLRLQAEYLNFKTRTQGEVSRMLKYEGEDFIKQILTVKDNFERAILLDDNDLSDEVSKFLSGFKMILGSLTAILDNYEVKEVDALGKEFDPHIMDAVLTEHDANKPENVVLEVLTKGYMYKDKLIRPAMVKVNK
jgi:molecular chaperone GrpE